MYLTLMISNRSAARTKLMDFGNAMTDCEKAISLNPAYVKAYARKAAIQALLKEYHKALATYDQGLHVEPDNAELLDGKRKVVMKINEVWLHFLRSSCYDGRCR